MRTTICWRVAVASSVGSNAASSPRCWRSSCRQSTSESSAPPWNGSTIRSSSARLRGRAHEEVAGEVHAFEPQAGAAPDLEIDHRQTDRDAGPAIEDFVQEAVARIVVVLAVAAEAKLLEEIGVQRRDLRVDRSPPAALQPRGRRFPHPLEPLQVGFGIEHRDIHARDRQRRRRNGFARLVERAQTDRPRPDSSGPEGEWHGLIIAPNACLVSLAGCRSF